MKRGLDNGGRDKVQEGLTTMRREQVEQAAFDLHLTTIPFTPKHAYQLFTLPEHHKDPWDRMLIGTALAEDVPIVASDREFKKYRGLRVLW